MEEGGKHGPLDRDLVSGIDRSRRQTLAVLSFCGSGGGESCGIVDVDRHRVARRYRASDIVLFEWKKGTGWPRRGIGTPVLTNTRNRSSESRPRLN
jgi:hypothetical protein